MPVVGRAMRRRRPRGDLSKRHVGCTFATTRLQQLQPARRHPCAALQAPVAPFGPTHPRHHARLHTESPPHPPTHHADFVLTFPGDWFSDVDALRRTGFTGQCVDSDVMFVRQVRELREAGVIP